MAIETRAPSSPVRPTTAASGTLRPVDRATIAAGDTFWAKRLGTNRERTIPHGWGQINEAGTLHNFRLAAGEKGEYRALGVMFAAPFPFLDSDVYKWLEAVGWELGRSAHPELAAWADEAIGLVAAAQRPDGYLNTFVQVLGGGRAFQDLQWGHELYCFGHLIQAAVAWHRALGDDRLLEIATRAVAAVDRELGPKGRLAIEGHPEIEMALVELFRTTGERSHLELARRLIEARGHGLLGEGRFGAQYWQDHLPVREAPAVAGHVVRQLYLDCGAVDVATELGDEELLGAVFRRWQDMVATRVYLTGGVGSRYTGEAFGDPFELPPDLAYAETCGAIASVMLAWRLLLATGDPACADLIERTIYNGVLPGVSLTGDSFFYVNALQRRTERVAAPAGQGERQAWFPCACCPPNVMRTLSSWPQYLATASDDGIEIHQYATADIAARAGGGQVRLAVATAYPWSGDVTVTIQEAPADPWTLRLRIPSWSGSATIAVSTGDAGGERGDGEVLPVDAGQRKATVARRWHAGDRVTLHLDMPIRVTEPDPRIDAVRGTVAIERGPLVYCIETADLPTGTVLEEISVDRGVEATTRRVDAFDGDIAGLSMTAGSIEVGAVPYFAWANRRVEAMRVWIPTDDLPAGEATGR